MTSIRGRLTVWLLAGMGLLLAAGGFLLDRVIGSRLLRELDAQLIQEARSLISSTEQQGGRVSLELADGVLPEFEPGGEPDYFQIWSGQGSPLARSRSLGALSLPRPETPAMEPRLADFTLPDGRPGRKVEISYRPQVEQEAGGERESVALAPPGSPPVTLAVASGRTDLDAFLASLHLTLILAVLGLLAATAVLVKTALRAGLAPLAQLAGQLESMNADSLGEPVAVEDVPAELTPTVRHLNGLLARLKESFERERTFSANLAHELRTPLAELRAVTEVALKWPDGPSSLQALEEARAIGIQMERVVANLLALARGDGSQQAVSLSEVPLREVATDCWSAFAAEAAAKGVAFDLDVPYGLVLVTDRDKLELILSNLFANAIAYGAPGRPVTCSAAVSGRDFALRVANATTDLTPEDLPRLFDRFWRKDAARSGGQHAGLGLGLVASLCESLGFKRDARLQGDVFDITLSGPCSRELNHGEP